ncbi:MAG: sigma 54-interacting transcriptional regulator [Acidobacteria bacterium]|nr:sigma 54-interacting transcriptional regulator [Acidobacteriota bacterium]
MLNEDNPDDLGLLGRSDALVALRRTVRRVAESPYPVLITGESGSGKELVARAVHRLSPRATRCFGAVNCAALTDDLVEAELFGYTKGAFTGAITERVGLFEAADRGTLFLDEVGELSQRAQAKLLRVLQDGEIRRVGENQPRKVDVRVVAATNRPLDDAVVAGQFREDLLYRLDVLRMVVPPLRDRGDDVVLLAEHFWSRAQSLTGSRAAPAQSTLTALARYHWPGNVRQLENVVASLVVRGPRHGIVGPSSLPHTFGVTTSEAPTLQEARAAFERRFVSGALARAGGGRGKAALELGVTRQGLAKLLKRLDLDAPPAGASRTSG